MKNEFVLAFNEVLEEKGLPKDIIVKALESAMVSAYRRAVNASNAQQVEAKIDLETGKITIFADKEVVDQVQDPRTEVTLAEARRYNPETEVGQMVVVESTPHDFGRVAAQTARQVIQQRIRDAERQAQLAFYDKQLGEIVSGIVQAVNNQGMTVGLEMRAEGSMPRKEMIPGERFRVHDRVRALLAEVKDSARGPQIILSRTHRNFLRRLLENEVPEIYHGIVEIRSIAREPGERAKVAVYATQQGIDPVGACVGIRGVRIQAIVRELHDEKIDVIEWNPEPSLYIAKALSPARVLGVYLSEKNSGGKTATVVVPEDQLSLAIGRDGQNARLAAKLTGWRIDIKSLPEATTDVVYRLQSDPLLAPIAESEASDLEAIEGMLARKAENRMLTPEEYDRMSQFVDRVEKRAAIKQQPEKKVDEQALQEARKGIPEATFSQNILDSGLTEHIGYTLQENGYTTTGELLVQMKINPDDILKLQGIGPRAMQEVNRLAEELMGEQPETHEEAEAVLEVEGPVPPAPETPTEAEEIDEVPGGFEEMAVADLETITQEDNLEVVESEELKEIEGKQEPVEKVFGTDTMSESTLETAVPVSDNETGDEGRLTVQEAAETDEKEEEPSFDELFTLRPEIISDALTGDDEEEDSSTKDSKKKGKKKSRRHVEIEYDPDADRTFVKKKHKRGDEFDW